MALATTPAGNGIKLQVEKGGADNTRYPEGIQRLARQLLNELGVPGKFQLVRRQRGRLPGKTEGAWSIALPVTCDDAGLLAVQFRLEDGKAQRYGLEEVSRFGKDRSSITTMKAAVRAYNEKRQVSTGKKPPATPINSKAAISAKLPEQQRSFVRLVRQMVSRSSLDGGWIFFDDALLELRKLLDKKRLNMGVALTYENTRAFMEAIDDQVAIEVREGVRLIRPRLQRLPDDLDLEKISELVEFGDLPYLLDRLVTPVAEVKKVQDAAAQAAAKLPAVEAQIQRLEEQLAALQSERSTLKQQVADGKQVDEAEANAAKVELERFLAVVQ